VQSFEAGGTSSTTTIEVLEYDIDVTVEAPPAASTVTLEDMMSGVPQG
jgi:hypothetical protein